MVRITVNLPVRWCLLWVAAAGLAVAVAGCGRRPRFEVPPGAVGRVWFPAPNGRHGVEIVDNPRRGIQEVWFRHRFREGVDSQVDALHSPGSLLWSPDGTWLVINHRDYGSLHDFLVFELTRHGLVEHGGMVERVQELWDRLQPEPMARLSFRGVRWSARGNRLLVLIVGQPENGDLVRQAVWLDPHDGVVSLAEAPADLLALPSPF